MYYLVLSLLLSINSISQPSLKSNEAIEKAVGQLTDELIANYSSNYKANIAILEFRTSANKISRLNQIIQKEINSSLGKLNKFKVIEQYRVNHILEEQGWSLTSSTSFKVYSSLNESFFKTNGTIADAFIYGVIDFDGSYMVITGYLVPDGLSSNVSKATVKIPIESVPSNLRESV
jgi:hypothetical protein